MLATYRGFYRYDKELLQKATGFARTYFTIDINETKENTLTGTVEDDIHTGGMQGIGIITGEIQGNSISFTKQMPKTMYMTVGTDGNSQRKELDRKHPLIYYTGTENSKRKVRRYMENQITFFDTYVDVTFGDKDHWYLGDDKI